MIKTENQGGMRTLKTISSTWDIVCLQKMCIIININVGNGEDNS